MTFRDEDIRRHDDEREADLHAQARRDRDFDHNGIDPEKLDRFRRHLAQASADLQRAAELANGLDERSEG